MFVGSYLWRKGQKREYEEGLSLHSRGSLEVPCA